jgi:hypothetical protein
MDERKKIHAVNDLAEFLALIENESKKIPGMKTPDITNLELERFKQALEEDALCAKYGKAKIETLAKKINYHGATINRLT